MVSVLLLAGTVMAGGVPAGATLLTGAFGAGAAWDGSGVATDGTTFSIDNDADGTPEHYPVPMALLPTSAFTFFLSAAPAPRVLYATRADTGCGAGSSARVFYYDVVQDTATAGHLTAITGRCIPNGIAFDGYARGQQPIAFVAGISLPGDGTQTMFWTNLGTGATGMSALTQVLDNVGFPEFAPSVTVAFTREVPPMATTATYHLVDLCPATLGTLLNPAGGSLANLAAPDPTAAVVDLGGGHYVARVSHPSLPGGSIDVPITDCLAMATTTTTTVPTGTTVVSTTTTTSTTSTTLPPTVITTDPYAPGGLLEVLGRVNAGQPGPITFALPGPAPYVIDLGLSTVFVQTPVTIDGTSQSAHGAPLVQIHNGQFDVQAPGCTIRGLAIDSGIFLMPPADGTLIQKNYLGMAPDGVTLNALPGSGVMVGTRNNVIQGNVIAGSILIQAPTATGNVVQGNRIGTNAAGTAAVNFTSNVEVNAANTIIGGTGAGDGNVITGGIGMLSSATRTVVAGNLIGTDASGAAVLGGGASVGLTGASHNTIGPGNVVTRAIGIQGGGGNTITGNLIGTDITGTRVIIAALGGGYPGPGINVLGSSDNIIGGTMAGEGNVIAGHASAVRGLFTDGILIDGDTRTPSERNQILGNAIGTDRTGTLPLPNDVGIDLVNATQDTVIGGTEAGAGNVITFNHGDGVRIVGGSGPANGNTVAGNRIDQNGFGIEVSGGANDNIAPPVLTAYTGGTTSTFVGHATGPPHAPLTIEFFANPAGDGEGRTFCGRKTYTADGGGTVAFSERFTCVSDPSEGASGTATATDAAGNTSEFSAIPGGTTTPPTGTTTTTLPLDSLAGVLQAITAVRNTLVAPPQPACVRRRRCNCAGLVPLLERVSNLIASVERAATPRKCTRKLHAAEHLAGLLHRRVQGVVARGCLAPAGRGATLARATTDLATRTQALAASSYCVAK
jgi:hypothetical protein